MYKGAGGEGEAPGGGDAGAGQDGGSDSGSSNGGGSDATDAEFKVEK
jgi:hypothetical protein